MPPTSTLPPPLKKVKWKMMKNTVLIKLLYINQLSTFLSSPSFIILSLSIISPSLFPLSSCLFRLGWDKWERMNTLGTWGSRRAECEGQGKERGNLNLPWLACKENNTQPMVTCYEWQSLWMVCRKRSRILVCLEKIGAVHQKKNKWCLRYPVDREGRGQVQYPGLYWGVKTSVYFK